MNERPPKSPRNHRFAAFLEANPGFDLLNHDFFDEAARARLAGDDKDVDEVLSQLRPYQRLLRVLAPKAAGERLTMADAEPLIEGLRERGFESAHDIAALAPHQFVRRTADLLGGEEHAREVHRRAVQVKGAVRHLFANARDVAGSPLTRASLARFADDDLVTYFQSLPSYQSLFGSLDYIEVPHCASIFSPAAYFLDLMRITDQYITDYNQATIPPGYELEERRPDLFDELELSCAETNTLVPQVSLVLRILVAKLTRDLGQDPYEVVATAPYPFNLPFNRPFSDLSITLGELGVRLWDFGKAMLAQRPEALGMATPALARAYLGLSAEQAEEVTTVNATDAAIGAQLGLATASEGLPKPGPMPITYVKDKTLVSGAGLGKLMHLGQSLESQGQIRTVVRLVDDDAVEVDIPFVESGTGVATWLVYGHPIDLTLNSNLRDVVGSMTYQDLEGLLTQHLSHAEIAAGEAGELFINATSENLPAMALQAADAQKGNVGTRLVNLSLARLDRLSRFIRLSRLTGIEYATLDWLMKIGEAAEITEGLLSLLASVKQIAEVTGLEVPAAAALVGPFKTTGRGNGPFPIDPFDLVFNPPSLLEGRDPRTSPSPIPFDPNRPLAWAPEGLSGPGVSGDLAGATATTAVLPQGASDKDGAYVGLALAITGGAGQDQVRIVKSYSGASRTAELYTAWTTTPAAGSSYRLSNAPGLEDRLAAALQVSKANLPALGVAYKAANAPGATALTLDLATLTGLWRLGKVAWIYRMPIAEYLVARSLAGLTEQYEATAATALADVQAAVTMVQWLQKWSLSAYELAYITTGARSRYVRPAFDPVTVPSILLEMASSSRGTHLTAATLAQSGFSAEEAERLVPGLRELGIIDAQGLLTPHDASYLAVSESFPVTEAALAAAAGLTAAEAQAAVATLAGELPPALAAIPEQPGSWALTASFDPASSLDELFSHVPDAQDKRLRTSKYLAGKAALVALAEISPLFPVVAATSFVTGDIGRPQSEAVFAALLATAPPVLLPGQTAQTGSLSATYDGDTAGWNLFQSPATGQSGSITAYDPDTRTATVAAPWTTIPDAFTYYRILRGQDLVLAGSAGGGAATTIVLAPDASNQEDFYAGCTIELVADPDAEGKTGEVRTVLDGVRAQQVILVEAIAATAAAQQAAALSGIAGVLSTPVPNVTAGLPYASTDFAEVRLLVPPLLGGDTASSREVATRVLDGLSRFGLLRERIVFGNAVWTAMSRQPSLFDLTRISALTVDEIRLLGAFKDFSRSIADDGSGVVSYLQVWPTVVSRDERLRILFDLTGWPAAQIAELDAFFLSTLSGYPGIGVLAGVLRLWAPFALIQQTSGDSKFLISMAGVATAAPLGPIGGAVNAALWTALDAAAQASMAVVAARYKDQDFTQVADRIRRASDTRRRDALMGYLLWTLHKTYPIIANPSDLFQYLLIDVETSGCDTTSSIAQGITSVQLYMQRARMGLEQGVTVEHIPAVWWEWMSTYRLWEANRKIYLYPENYLVPSQRRSATPEFKALGDALMQGRPTEQNVAKAMVEYFDEFEVLASLVPVGATKAGQVPREGGQIDEAGVIVGRTNTSPYKYFLRRFTRSFLSENTLGDADPLIVEWEPWLAVDASIEAPFVMPVWSFDRTFLFWNETKPTKSSTIETSSSSSGLNAASSTQSTWQTTLRYTFPTSTGGWLSPQQAMEPTPIRVAPNTYVPANDANVKVAFANVQHYWSQPFAQAIPRGLPGTGTLTFQAGQKVATGDRTRLDKQVQPGDFIVAAGQKLQVEAVDAAAQRLTTRTAFVVGATKAPFNVVPKDPARNRYAPYQGPGTVRIVANTNIVDGTGTQFTIDFTPGDFIQVGDETRTVTAIFSDVQLVVGRKWTIGTETKGAGSITLFPKLTTVSGQGTQFLKQARPGELVSALGQSRTIFDVEDDTSILVTSPFDVTSITTADDYTLGAPGTYRVLPRASGEEKLAVLYGPNLDTQTDYGPIPDAPPHDENKGDDPFIAATNDFNLSLYDGLSLIKVVKNDPSLPQKGDITAQSSRLLNGALTPVDLRLYSPAASSLDTGTSPLFQLGVDRENNVLYTRLTDRPLVSLYWGNSTPGTTANQAVSTPQDRPLLYHTNSQNAVLTAVGNQVGWYLFNNNTDYLLFTLENASPVPVGDGVVLQTFWQPGSAGDLMLRPGPYTLDSTGFYDMKFRVTRLSTDVAGPLKQRLFVSLDRLLSLESQYLPESPIDQYFQTPQGEPPPALDAATLPPDIMSFNGAYGLYFWEIFYHSPMLVAEWLKSNRDFETAKRWYEHIFDPTAPRDPEVPDDSRFWQFRPFREDMTIPSLKRVLSNTFEINLSNSDPFDPHAIARLRISAYAKNTVLRYVDNLILWADALFTLDTRESITQAQGLYVLARDLLGEQPQVVGVFQQPEPLTYSEIKAKYPNGIPQYLIDLENTPFLPATGQGQRYGDVPVNDIHAYFGVPDNRELLVFWEIIDDRLYKIRHCMNINGVTRQLALFAPPIDPAALVAGFGSSGSLAGGSVYMPYPIPNYRFSFLIQMARSLADQVMRFGASLLGALERRDGEALAQLQLSQQAQILQMGVEIREQAIVQIDDQAEALQQGLNSATARKDHYTRLLDRGMLPEEIAEVTLMGVAAGFSAASSVLGAAASVAAAFPQIGSPFAITFGGQQLGPSLQNASGWTAAIARVLETTSSILSVVAGHKRRVEDWELQKKLAEIDMAQMQAQIAANAVQKKIAERELSIQLVQIDQNQALQDFYEDKFTNEALFAWMAGRLSTTYFQAYSLALELARMAQRAYQLEYRTQTSFIAATYWDDLRKGLTAGEALSQALSQLEVAYVRAGIRLQEITKTISLRQLDPVAFLTFTRTGETRFDLSERLFDEDFPGQYRRRIKTVSVSVPALVGPYQNIHATLTQTANRLVLDPDIDAVKFLLGDDVAVPEGKIEHNVRVNQKISLSRAQGDTGVFDPSPSDPMYLPFEQTGAVSSWQLSMPKANNRISFEGISDVILEVRYSALDGGDAFRAKVAALPQLRERSWTQLIQPALQYQAEWSRFMTGPVITSLQTLRFDAVRLIPPNTNSVSVLGIYVLLDVPSGTDLGSRKAYLTLSVGSSDPVTVLPGPDGAATAIFDTPVPLKTGQAAVVASFDMRPGYTPSALRTEAGDRLDPAVLRDLDIVLFLSGKV
jgi:hypothetical protein